MRNFIEYLEDCEYWGYDPNDEYWADYCERIRDLKLTQQEMDDGYEP